MWRHIGDNPRYVQLDEVTSPLAGNKNQRQPIDWSSSSCGLFTGLLSLVALIINLIVYFALVNQVSITKHAFHSAVDVLKYGQVPLE